MSDYYLGDPCYVIPDAEWGDFCSIMRDDGEEFEYKGETCVVIGTGGDGDFGGLSVDAGIIGCIPVSLCDPVSLRDTVINDARLVDSFVSLEEYNGFIVIDGEPLGAGYCECRNCSGNNDPLAEHELEDCRSCGTPVKYDCQFEGVDGNYYCSEDCAPEPVCDYCNNNCDEGESVCDDCRHHTVCGCEKDDPEDEEGSCIDCRKP